MEIGWIYIYFVVHYVRRVISYNYGKFHEVCPLNATWFKPIAKGF